MWNQKVFDDAGGGLSGGIQGVAKSPAAGAAGMMLAMNGLFGSRRVGAGTGFLAGLGEKAFGVESPENEAKRLVKQLYSISIDNSMAKQIAVIAQQKYAGHVSIAVRDPDVRKLLCTSRLPTSTAHRTRSRAIYQLREATRLAPILLPAP